MASTTSGGSGAERTGALERELASLRRSEADYRERLAAHVEAATRLRDSSNALFAALRARPASARALAQTLADVARISSRALAVARTSVWLFGDDGRTLECRLLIIDGEEPPTPGISLPTSQSPAYFEAVRNNVAVPIRDVRDDPRAVGLEAYLNEHGVGAMLDISITSTDGCLGVVCHEHTGGPRDWTSEEIDFATHVGNVVALALEAERRHTAEMHARGSEARYRYLVESLPVAVYSFEPRDSRLRYLSPQAREIGGTDASVFLERGVGAWLAMIHPDDRPQVQARFAPHGIDEGPAEIVYRIAAPDGTTRYIRDQVRVVRDHAGQPLAIQGVLADITSQRVAEQRSREFERRLQTLLENVGVLALVIDPEGRIEFVNTYFESVTGYSRQEVLGKDCFELLVPPAEADATRERYLADVRRKRIVPRFEQRIATRTGEIRRIVWTNTLRLDDDGNARGSSSLGLDITDRARMEAEMLQHTKLESLGQLAAGVAHDFNNLLTAMMGQVHQLGAAPSTERGQTALRVLEDALRQAGELTRSLMVYARKQPIDPASIEVDRLVDEMRPLLHALVVDGPQLELSLQADDAVVRIDPAQMRQLVLNLVGNAVDATKDATKDAHGRSVRVTTSEAFLDDSQARGDGAPRGGHFVRLTVADDGKGMDAATLARAFDPFFTSKGNGLGTGIGLPLCQSVAARAGGFIRARSEVGQGSTFEVYLPIEGRALGTRDSAVSVVVRRASAPSLPEATEPRPVVLVVEDVPVVRELMVDLMIELGLEVRAVSTCGAAAQVISSEPVDILVTDGRLPDGSGVVLARSARATRPQILTVLVSGSLEEAPEFDANLTKPFEPWQLQEVILGLLSPAVGRNA